VGKLREAAELGLRVMELKSKTLGEEDRDTLFAVADYAVKWREKVITAKQKSWWSTSWI
jgi:hypothetical protein